MRAMPAARWACPRDLLPPRVRRKGGKGGKVRDLQEPVQRRAARGAREPLLPREEGRPLPHKERLLPVRELRDGLLLPHGGLGMGVDVRQLAQDLRVRRGVEQGLQVHLAVLRRLGLLRAQGPSDLPPGGVRLPARGQAVRLAQGAGIRMRQERGHQEVQRAGGVLRALRPGVQVLFQAGDLAHERQAVLRTRHEHVEDAHLLGEALPPLGRPRSCAS